MTTMNLGHHSFRKLKPCIHCARAKMKQKKIAKETAEDRVQGSRIGMDLTWCAERTAAGNECTMAMTDYETDEAWMKSLKKKDEVPEK